MWDVAMCGRLTKAFPDPSSRRLLVSNNFYTRHNLARTLPTFTDGEMEMLGTVRIPLQGKWIGSELDAAKSRMDAASRGSWELIAAINVPPGWEKLQEAHKRAQKKLPPQQQTIVAYNLLMNSVDRVDQLRSTNPIRRKEKRLSMSILTWTIDLALINVFALFQKIAGVQASRVKLREFKRRVAESLTPVQRMRMENARGAQPAPTEPINNVLGADESLHAITPKLKGEFNRETHGFSKKALFGCTSCHWGFHVSCFTAFHYRDALTSSSLSVRSALDAVCAAASGDANVQTRLKKNRTITYLDKLELP
ncbi:hypothetical protein P3T76_008853 [Phytophthora citrophthora]|uniref:PiggyBac transposable element-derived protein domain-containing protein n=1 Tax=Phytophthora citrophthora TaxID=4793 RepID=A0AAD9GIH8_9STRA|nr:hypothetical protein P3T76_008853 [Phytophthora citrophthora]